MKRVSALLILCAALALPGCLQHDAVVRSPLVGSRVRVDLREVLSPTGRSLEMRAATEQIYPCVNYTLNYQLVRVGDRLNVDFTGVTSPAICLTALGPARCLIPLGATREGTFPLTLTVDGVATPGQLVVTAGTLELRGIDGDAVVAERPLVRRVPPGTIWGLIGWGPADQSARVKAFRDSLVAAGAQRVDLLAGDYDYFQVGKDGAIVTPDPSGYTFAEAFLYHYAGDRGALPNLVAEVGYPPPWITLHDDLGGTWATRPGPDARLPDGR